MNKKPNDFNQESFTDHNFGSWVWYLDTGEMKWDQKNCNLFGLTLDQAPQNLTEFQKMVIPEDFKKIIYDFEQAILNHKPLFTTFRISTPTGLKTVKMVGNIFYKDQEPIKVSGFNLIDESKSLEDHNRLTNLGQVAGTIAHEINTPLTSILFRVDYVLNNTDLAPAIKQQLEQVKNTVNKIAKITDTVRLMARDGSKDPFESVDLTELFTEVQNLCSTKLQRHKVQISFNNNYLGKINGKKVQLTQVLVNLINNAIDAVKTLDDKWIKVETNVKESNLQIKVQDSGGGIPQEVMDKIFTPFFTTKPPGEGTGLGLGFCLKIMKQHRGSLTIDKTNPHTCFILHLPLTN